MSKTCTDRAEKPATSNDRIQAKISNNKSVFIQSINPDVPLSDPVYAINWFNTRLLWLYNLYNLLAAPVVRKVSGKAFLKARVNAVLHGSEQDRRGVLLIVRYPAIMNFKSVLETTYFKLVSILRIFAVTQFTFGFSRRSDAQTVSPMLDKNKVYAIHHYRGEHDIAGEISRLLKDQAIEIVFAGRISALLFSGDQSRPIDQVPCLMDGAVILQADTRAELEAAIQGDDYQAIIEQTQSSFIATLDRIV